MTGARYVATLPTFETILHARDVLTGHALRTPLLESAQLNALTGGRILIKPEVLQHTGSFKFRGAFNRIAQIRRAAPGTPVVACSSGNHAQGVAAAAALHKAPATIVMPADAPAIKLERTRALGATVVLYDRLREDRAAIAADIAARTGAVDIPPFDDPGVISGQGTVGLEICQDLQAMDVQADAVLVPCGGGGLTAGIALAMERLSPKTALFTVEPDGFDDQARSFAAGTRQTNKALSGSICDALLSPSPGEITFAINHGRVARGLSVSDDQALGAMAVAFETLKLVVEPGGAVALAAVLGGLVETRGRVVVCVLSGGNVDRALFARALAGERAGAALR